MIFTTGDTVGDEARRFFEATGHAVISKPFNLDEVERLIADILADQPA